MNKDDIALLFRYNAWAWDRVLAQVRRVSPEQYVAPSPAPYGSLRGTLVHAMSAESTWLRRWEGDSPAAMWTEADFPTVDALLTRWADQRAALTEFLAAATDAELNAPLAYKTLKGIPQSDILWHLMAHVVNHGSQHRSEAALMLTEHGFSPGDLDLSVFLRETRG